MSEINNKQFYSFLAVAQQELQKMYLNPNVSAADLDAFANKFADASQYVRNSHLNASCDYGCLFVGCGCGCHGC